MEALEAVLAGYRRRDEVVSADVLDAWYPPSPLVLARLGGMLEFLVSASPPTYGEGLRTAIGEARGVDPATVLVGSGSSSLMFLAIPRLFSAGDTVAVLDPMYGEYAHLAEHVVGASVRRIELGLDSFRPSVEQVVEGAQGCALLALVNPNSPTGEALNLDEMRGILEGVDRATTVWVDETYIDFFSIESGRGQSVEGLVSEYSNLVVSKSMSKFYALSGLRVGYLVASAGRVAEWELYSPPWSVGTLATVAAEAALADTDYYRGRAMENAGLRRGLAGDLRGISGVERVVEGSANFVLVRLRERVASELTAFLAERSIFIRDCASLSSRFENETVRVSVLTEDANRRVVEAMASFWG